MIWNSAKHALPLQGRIRMNLVKLSRSNRISFDFFFVTLSHHDIDLPHEPPSNWKPMLTLHGHVKEEPNWDFPDVTNISFSPLRALFLHFCHASKRKKKESKKGHTQLFLFYRALKEDWRKITWSHEFHLVMSFAFSSKCGLLPVAVAHTTTVCSACLPCTPSITHQSNSATVTP